MRVINESNDWHPPTMSVSEVFSQDKFTHPYDALPNMRMPVLIAYLTESQVVQFTIGRLVSIKKYKNPDKPCYNFESYEFRKKIDNVIGWLPCPVLTSFIKTDYPPGITKIFHYVKK